MTTLVSLRDNLRFSEMMGLKVKRALLTAAREIAAPAIGILCFLLVWSAAADRVDTSLGKFPIISENRRFSRKLTSVVIIAS